MTIPIGKRALALAAATLMLVGGMPTRAEQVYVSHDSAKVYNINGQVLGEVPAATELELTGMKGVVCQVERDGHTAYMLKEDLSLTKPAAQPEAEVAAQPAVQTMQVTAYANKADAAVYSATGGLIGRIPVNTEVTITAVKSGICRVTHAGKTAYMKQSDLSERKVEVAEPVIETFQATTAYANKDSAAVYNLSGSVIGRIPLNTEVQVTGAKGSICRVTHGGRTAYMKQSDLSNAKTEVKTAEQPAETPKKETTSATGPAKGTAREMDWWTSDIQEIFARGVTAKITDVATGLSWYEQRRGGTNHADCQPLTAADTAKLKQAYGGKWSWNRRAVFVTINGVNYAASINGMPHGGGSITDNNFNGHHCIHFTNSRTHGSNKVDAQHQAAIKVAASTTLR